jgi:hypothetical protein
MDELHVVDVRRTEEGAIWVVHLSNGYVMHVSAFNHPDELSVYTRVTNTLQKEQVYGINSRA